jgi:hypothetical protein
MVWSKLIERLDSVTSMMSLFSANNANKFITHTILPLKKDCSRADWLSVVKTEFMIMLR